MYDDYEDLEMGDSLGFSAQCNPDFKDTDGDNCEGYAIFGYCDASANFP